MHPLERRILDTLRGQGLVAPGTRGLVCVSGGPDSLALLHLLHAVRESLGLALEVVHFDHGLRAEAPREAERVAAQARALGLPCHVVRTEHLAGRTRGLQAAARAWRRAETRRLAAQWAAQWAATGHQRDDHLETLLLKWLRGAHISRLRGMAWRQGLFVRPLLETSRAELTGYLEERGADWLEDPTNRDPHYLRNRVRHELLPLLDALTGGSAHRRLAAVEAQSAGVEALLRAVLEAQPVAMSPAEAGDGTIPRADAGEGAHWIDADRLAALPRLAAAKCLHDFVVARLPGALAAGHVESALNLLHRGAPAWELHLSHGRRLRRRGERLLLERQPADAARRGAEPDTAAADTVQHTLGGRTVVAPAGWEVRAVPPADPPADAAGTEPAQEPALTLHNLPPRAELQVRRREAGDRFHPPWKARPVKLAAFLRDQHVPLWERERLPVVVLEGQVIGVYPRYVARGYEVPLAPGETTGGTRTPPPLRLAVRAAG